MTDPASWTIDNLSDDVRARVKSELSPGERLLWAGVDEQVKEPIGCVAFGSAVVAVTCWAVVLICVAAPYFVYAGQDHGYVGFGVLAGVLAVLLTFGVSANLNHRRNQYRERSRNMFALTDRRAIIWRGVPNQGTEVHSFGRESVLRVHRVEYPDDTGDLNFSVRDEREHYGFFSRSFTRIRHVRLVEETARRVLLEIPNDGPSNVH